MNNILKIKTGVACLLSFIALGAFAQKLPNKQQGSMRPPANVKTDGKANEWTYSAFNRATDVFYTIANDNNNLYLTLKVENVGIIRKIISGGITFSVNSSGKKSDENTVAITYPIFNLKTKPYINFGNKPTGSGPDSFVLANNRRFSAQSKFVRTAGVKGVDTLISVYNTDGVKVASSFDKDMNYICELAISLNHVRQALNTEGKLFYRVTLNPIQMDDMPGINITRDAGGTITSITVNRRDALPNSASMSATTDFSDEYVLLK